MKISWMPLLRRIGSFVLIPMLTGFFYGCQQAIQTMDLPTSLQKDITIPSGSDTYKAAFTHGCNSGWVVSGNHAPYTKLNVYYSDAEYARGWDNGFAKCAKTMTVSNEIKRALDLAQLKTDADTVELINYFYASPQKAFAINPDSRSNFWWIRGRSDSRVVEDTLQKCGSSCKIFAINNNVVWEKEKSFEVHTSK